MDDLKYTRTDGRCSIKVTAKCDGMVYGPNIMWGVWTHEPVKDAKLKNCGQVIMMLTEYSLDEVGLLQPQTDG